MADDAPYENVRASKLKLKTGEDITAPFTKRSKRPAGAKKARGRAKKQDVHGGDGTSTPEYHQGEANERDAKRQKFAQVAPRHGVGVAPDGKGNASSYEELFPQEKQRIEAALHSGGGARSAAWQNSYRAPPEVLHGRHDSWRKKEELTAEEAVELRASVKSDKMCR